MERRGTPHRLRQHTAENVYNMHRTEKREVQLNKNSEKNKRTFSLFPYFEITKK